jgi:hypothetical protein
MAEKCPAELPPIMLEKSDTNYPSEGCRKLNGFLPRDIVRARATPPEGMDTS